jgi:hypothetical protein
MSILLLWAPTWNNDVSKVSLVGDVIDAKPTDVENGEFSGK